MTQDTPLPELLRIPAEDDFSQPISSGAGGNLGTNYLSSSGLRTNDFDTNDVGQIDELDDEDFAPPRPRGRASKPTIALAGLAVLALGFLGGALVQKHEGTSSTTALAARAGRLRGAAGAGGFAGFGEGGFGAAGTGAAGTGATGTGGAGAGSSTTTTPAAPGPVAIGTVVSVSGTTVVVKDLGGKSHTLTIGSGVTVSTSSPFTATGLKAGQAVTVDGTTGTGGAVTVTTIIRRS